MLIYGDLPSKVRQRARVRPPARPPPSSSNHTPVCFAVQAELDDWQEQIFRHTPIHNNLTQLMKSFNYDAHPMGMFISVIAGMSTFHPEANPSLQVRVPPPPRPTL